MIIWALVTKRKNIESFFNKIQNTKVILMEEVLSNEIEDEILQIFLCDGIASIKVEENTSKN